LVPEKSVGAVRTVVGGLSRTAGSNVCPPEANVLLPVETPICKKQQQQNECFNIIFQYEILDPLPNSSIFFVASFGIYSFNLPTSLNFKDM